MPVCKFCNGTGTRNYFDRERNETVDERCEPYKLASFMEPSFWVEETRSLLQFLFPTKNLETVQEDVKLATFTNGFVFTFTVNENGVEKFTVQIRKGSFFLIGNEYTRILEDLILCHQVEGAEFAYKNLASILNGIFQETHGMKLRRATLCKR